MKWHMSKKFNCNFTTIYLYYLYSSFHTNVSLQYYFVARTLSINRIALELNVGKKAVTTLLLSRPTRGRYDLSIGMSESKIIIINWQAKATDVDISHKQPSNQGTTSYSVLI